MQWVLHSFQKEWASFIKFKRQTTDHCVEDGSGLRKHWQFLQLHKKPASDHGGGTVHSRGACDVYFISYLSVVLQYPFNTISLSLPPKRLLPRLSFPHAPCLLVKNSYIHPELLCERCCSKNLACMCPCSPHGHPIRWMLLISPPHRWRREAPESLMTCSGLPSSPVAALGKLGSLTHNWALCKLLLSQWETCLLVISSPIHMLAQVLGTSV